MYKYFWLVCNRFLIDRKFEFCFISPSFLPALSALLSCLFPFYLLSSFHLLSIFYSTDFPLLEHKALYLKASEDICGHSSSVE